MGVARGNIRTTVVVGGEQEYFQIMKKLRAQQTTLRSEAKALASTYDKTTTSQQKLKDSAQILSKQIQVQEQIVQGYKQELEKEIEASGEGSKRVEELSSGYNYAATKLNNLEKKLKEVNNELKKHGEAYKAAGEKISEYGGKIESAGDKISGAGQKISVLSAGIGTAMYKATEAAIDYESAFTGVTKTVDASEEEFEQLYGAMIDLSTEIPTTASEIANVAEVAGQLGIKQNDLLDFTKVMINLGESTNLNAEEAASALAKFANVTDMSASDYERLGSVIVDLGNNFATTEADIVSMATNLASTGTLTGLTQSQIMAIATALNSVGIEADAGGTAMSKLLKQMQLAVETNSEDLKKFADVSNMTVSEFKELWGRDAVAAVGAFTNGLNDTERNGKSAVAVLADMDIKEARLSNTILALASSNGILSEAVDTANGAWEENTALQAEAQKRYETLESKIQICKNTLNKIAIEFGEELMPYVEKGIDKIEKLSDKFSDLSDEEKQQVIKIAAVVAAAGPLLIIIGKTTSAAGSLITAGGKLIQTIGRVKTGEASASLRNFANTLKDVSGEQQSVAAGAAKLIGSNAAVCVAIAATAAVVIALAAAYRELEYGNKQTRETMKDLGDSIEDFSNKIENASGDVSALKNAIDFDDKTSELESQYNEIQDKIISIATKASEERRSLTDTEKENLQELFDELNLVTQKEAELFADALELLGREISAEANLTEEASAELIARNKALLEEAEQQITDSYDRQFATIVQTHKEAGTLNSELYNQDIQELQSWRDSQLQILQQNADDNANLINSKIAQNSGGYDVLLEKFTNYTNEMAVVQTNYNETALQNDENNFGASLGNYISYLIQKKQLNDDFSSEFLEQNQEVVGNYLASVDSMLQEGQTLDSENQAIVESIISAYETLPESSSKPWKDTMERIKSVIDESNISKKGEETGGNFNKGVEKGLENSQSSVKEKIKKFANDWLDTIKSQLGIHSPSTKAAWIAEMFDLGLIKGFEKSENDVYERASDVADGIMENMQINSSFTPDIKFPELAKQYAASIASSNAMQSIYHQTYVNNNSSLNNYYSTNAAGGQTVHEEIKAFRTELIGVLNNAFSNSDNILTERQAGRVIRKCLKSVGM